VNGRRTPSRGARAAAAGTPGALSATRTDGGPVVVSFTCPRCFRTSHNPTDAAEGYCGACHDFTGCDGDFPPIPVSSVWVSDCLPHEYVPGAHEYVPGSTGAVERPCRECGGFRLDPLHVLG
jgi:hypothetical protein